MPVVTLSIFGGVGTQFFDNNGNPLTGGKIQSFQAGTTTPLATYTSSSGSVAHTNPIILDSAGRVPSGGEIWNEYTYLYKFVLSNANNVVIATFDNVGGSFNASPIVANFTGTGAQVNFVLASSPSNENNTQIYINGVYQQKNTYSVSASTITFSEAPPINSKIEVNYL